MRFLNFEGLEVMEDLDYIEVSIRDERARQTARWGEQNHPDGTGEGYGEGPPWNVLAAKAKFIKNESFRLGQGTWRHILQEEIAEVFAETDPVRLKAELVQVAAVCKQWVECIDRRNGKNKNERLS